MLYINLKSGKVYEYLNLALNASEDQSMQTMVSYKDIITNVIYVINEKEFNENFDLFVPHGSAVDNILNGVN